MPTVTLLRNPRAASAVDAADAVDAVDTAAIDTFVYVAADDALAQPLLDELEREYEARYGTFFGEPASAEIHRYPTSAQRVTRPPASNAGGADQRAQIQP